jgi:trimeric autotransporter adhesin
VKEEHVWYWARRSEECNTLPLFGYFVITLRYLLYLFKTPLMKNSCALNLFYVWAGMLLFASPVLAQNKNLGIGTASPNTNAVLHIESPTNNQGVIFPRLTTAQRTAMSALLDADDNGLMLYDTDLKSVFIWEGSSWATSSTEGVHVVNQSGTEVASSFLNQNVANDTAAVYAKTFGTGNAGYFEIDNAATTQPAIYAKSNGGFTSNSAGVLGESNGGFAGVIARQKSGLGNALVAQSQSPEIGSWGLLAESINGSAAYFTSSATAEPAVSINANGTAGGLDITAGANTTGIGLTVFQNGTGRAGQFQINNASNSNAAVRAVTAGTGAAGFFTINNASNTNPGVTINTNGLGPAIYGQNTSTSNAIAGLFRNSQASNTYPVIRSEAYGGGSAAQFETSESNNSVAVQINANGNNGGLNVYQNDENAWTPAIMAHTDAQGAAFQAVSTDSSVYANAAEFIVKNPTNPRQAVYATTLGTGNAVLAESATAWSTIVGRRSGSSNGNAGYFEITNAGNNYGALSAYTIGTGAAGNFAINNPSNNSSVLTSTTNGGGDGIYSDINSSSSNNAAIKGRAMNDGGVGGAFEIFGTSNSHDAMYAFTNGTGQAGRFNINGSTNSAHALSANTSGTGTAFNAYTATGWTAIQATQAGSNNALHSENTGTGTAGYFTITNASNNSTTLNVNTVGTGGAVYVSSSNVSSNFPAVAIDNSGTGNSLDARASGTGNALSVNHTGASGNLAVFKNNSSNVARIDKSGVGYFNGGTLSTGADVAEMFEVEGSKSQYEPGDVLVISESTDRTVEKSNSSNSTRVAGVYATKPGVRLTEREIDQSIDDLVPMGVVGVIPTKVCRENGPIKRGDLLVTSSKSGHAMKAIPVNINGVLIYPTGAILGKALENFDGNDSGLIKVLVNVK